jgi:hypothetical protein
MDYTELINGIKNKLKRHQYKIDAINKTIDLETNIKNDLEANFNERVEIILIGTDESRDLINVSNSLEKYIEFSKKNSKDSKIALTIQQLKDKRADKLDKYNLKKVEITNKLHAKIQKLTKNIEKMKKDVDLKINTRLIPSMNGLEHLRRLNFINRFIEKKNIKKLLRIRSKIKSQINSMKNVESVNATIKKEHLEIQMDLVDEGIQSIKDEPVAKPCPKTTIRYVTSVTPSVVSSPITTVSSSPVPSTPSPPSTPSTISMITNKDANTIRKNKEAIEATRAELEALEKKRIADQQKRKADDDAYNAKIAADRLKRNAQIETELVNEAVLREKRKKEAVEKANRELEEAVAKQRRFHDENTKKELEEANRKKKKMEDELAELQRSLDSRLQAERKKIEEYRAAKFKADADKMAAEIAAAIKIATDKSAREAKESKEAAAKLALELEKNKRDAKDAIDKSTKANRDLLEAQRLKNQKAIDKANEDKRNADKALIALQAKKDKFILEAKDAKAKADRAAQDARERSEKALKEAADKAEIIRKENEKVLKKARDEKDMADKLAREAREAENKSRREKAVADQAVLDAQANANQSRRERDAANKASADARASEERAKREKENAERIARDAKVERDKANKEREIANQIAASAKESALRARKEKEEADQNLRKANAEAAKARQEKAIADKDAAVANALAAKSKKDKEDAIKAANEAAIAKDKAAKQKAIADKAAADAKAAAAQDRFDKELQAANKKAAAEKAAADKLFKEAVLAREKAQREAKEASDRAAVEKTAREQAQRDAAAASKAAAAAKAAKEQAERDAKAASDRAAAERAAREQAQRDAKAANEAAAAAQAAREQALRDAKIASDKAAAEKAQREKAQREAKEASDRADAERAAAERARREAKAAADKAAAEKAAREQAQRDAQAAADRAAAAKAAAERAAREQAEREAAAAKAAAEAAARNPALVPLSKFQDMFNSSGCKNQLTEESVKWWRTRSNLTDVQNDMNAYSNLNKNCSGNDGQHEFCHPGKCRAEAAAKALAIENAKPERVSIKNLQTEFFKTDITIRDVPYVAMTRDGKHIAISETNNTIWYSEDTGSSWKKIRNGGDKPFFVSVFVAKDAKVIVYNGWQNLWWSTDKGANWNSAERNEAFGQLTVSYPSNIVGSDDGRIIYGAGYKICKSEDYGKNWRIISDIGLNEGDLISQICCSSDGATVVACRRAGDGFGRTFISRNYGNSWNATSLPKTGYHKLLCSADAQIIALSTMDNGANPTIYVSTDSGNNWTSKRGPSGAKSSTGFTLSGDGTVMVFGGQNWWNGVQDIFISRDLGDNWTKVKSPQCNWESIASSHNGGVIVAAPYNRNQTNDPVIMLNSLPGFASKSKSFNPKNTTSARLLAWFDANDINANGSSVPNGTQITSWKDKSGNNNDANKQNGNQPIVLGNHLNGKSVLDLRDSTQFLSNFNTNLQQYTLFSVQFGKGDWGNWQRLVHGGNMHEDGRLLWGARYNTSEWMTGIGNTGWTQLDTDQPGQSIDNKWSIADTVINVPTNTTLTSFNGTKLNPKNNALAGFSSIIIGSHHGGGGQFWKGHVAEILMYNGLMNDDERAKVQGYLAWKWGLERNLPSNHPFKNVAPGGSGATEQFNLKSIDGLVSWYDGSDPIASGSAPSNGSAVTVWNDKSGNGKNGTRASGNPTFDVATKSVVFDGGSIFNLPNGSLPFNNSAYSMFIVVSSRNPSPPQWYISGGSGQVLGSAILNNNISNSWANGGSELWKQSPIVANKPIMVELTYDRTSRGINFNGTSAGTDQAGQINNNDSRNVIGYSPVYGQPLNGNIYEIVIFNKYLSTDNRQKMEGYLAHKWGIQGDLPASHPFKNAAPGGSKAEGFDPVSYLPLVENNKDLGMSPKNIEQSGQVQFTTVNGRKCAYFNNRMDTFLRIPNTTTTKFTVSFFYLVRGGDNYTMVSRSNDGWDPRLQFDLQLPGNLRIYLGLPNPWTGLQSTTRFEQNKWYHITLTVDETNASMFVNGTFEAKVQGSAPMQDRPYWVLGRSGDNGRAADVCIAHFAVWNKVISASEIEKYFNASKTDSLVPIGTSGGSVVERMVSGCEGENARIVCSSGKKIKGLNYKYGKWEGNGKCGNSHADSSRTMNKYVEPGECVGKESCDMSLGNNWGDPWGGVRKQYEVTPDCK